jgi:hypothetical protein
MRHKPGLAPWPQQFAMLDIAFKKIAKITKYPKYFKIFHNSDSTHCVDGPISSKSTLMVQKHVVHTKKDAMSFFPAFLFAQELLLEQDRRQHYQEKYEQLKAKQGKFAEILQNLPSATARPES